MMTLSSHNWQCVHRKDYSNNSNCLNRSLNISCMTPVHVRPGTRKWNPIDSNPTICPFITQTSTPRLDRLEHEALRATLEQIGVGKIGREFRDDWQADETSAVDRSDILSPFVKPNSFRLVMTSFQAKDTAVHSY